MGTGPPNRPRGAIAAAGLAAYTSLEENECCMVVHEQLQRCCGSGWQSLDLDTTGQSNADKLTQAVPWHMFVCDTA